ncbi:glycopeptide antibiotics resistance protein [Paeniglutamicibacter kerguelensis]|uniref:Glycopeptide antibiotics resistance protein n=2 Tax=Paeniglutamicibacter kerguelensis TaxID=254788 RepID=A0ABS4XCI7_9MICC|nr:glycopeptide antibiotics resistance protein [Paeniglutamicibacter kerguelensis]
MSAMEKKPSREGGRVLPLVLFVVYLVLLAWMVLLKLEVPYAGGGALRQIKLVPFAPSAGAGASDPLEVVANTVLLVSFGLYLGLLAPSWPWWRAAGAFAGASLVLEVSQHVLAIGISDVTDLLVNTAGGLAGFGLLTLARRGLQARTATVMTRVCSIGTVFALLAIAVFVASPIRYGPPRDLPGLSTPDRNAGTPAREHAPAP